MNKDEILKAFEYRHACKIFDDNKKIPEEDIRFVLETGRLSPSSFGLEQWKFLVTQNQNFKNKLCAASFDQPQLSTCSHVVIILAKKGLYNAGSEHVVKMFKRWNYPEETYKVMIDLHAALVGNVDQVQWAIEQCNFAASNMMTSAAMIGIDSCAIGGFEPDKVKDILNIDSEKYELALMIPFGYRCNPQPPKARLPFDEVVEFI